MALQFTTSYIEDSIKVFRYYKKLAERAMAQVTDEQLYVALDAEANSIAIVIKHLTGNMLSRWTDFLTTDGEKPWRDRDGEFVIGQNDTRQNLLAAWGAAFAAVDASLAGLGENDLLRKVRVRNEELTVFQATHRSLAHTSYHCGQIIYLSRLLTKDGWKWITIPPNRSKEHMQGSYLK